MPTDAVMEMHIEMLAEKFGQSPYETDYDLEKFRRGRAEYRGTKKDLANLTWDEFLNEIREEPADVCNQVAVAPLFFNLTQDQKSLLTQIYILGQASKRALRMLRNAQSAEARTSRSEGDAPPAETASGAGADKPSCAVLTGYKYVCPECGGSECTPRAGFHPYARVRDILICVDCAHKQHRAIHMVRADSVDLSDKGEEMLGEALDDVAEGRIGGMEVIDNDEGAD